MNRQSSYSCSCTPAAPHKHHSTSHATSSAFSASANPDEDWTKISDLAERRRIQNRIAQRNYRKKLKRRLEDLERRAASSSASPSPEQKYAQLDKAALARNSKTGSMSSSSRHSLEESYLANQGYEYMIPSQNAQAEDKGMFSYQHTRQLSTSPPPLISYQSYSSTESASYAPEPRKNNYFSIPITSPDASYMLAPNHGFTNCLPNAPPSNIKQEYYEEDDINPFSLSYASMAGVDIPNTYGYQPPMTLTPALSDSFEHSSTGSPLEFSSYPLTPGMPLTPPPQPYETNPYEKM